MLTASKLLSLWCWASLLLFCLACLWPAAAGSLLGAWARLPSTRHQLLTRPTVLAAILCLLPWSPGILRASETLSVHLFMLLFCSAGVLTVGGASRQASLRRSWTKRPRGLTCWLMRMQPSRLRSLRHGVRVACRGAVEPAHGALSRAKVPEMRCCVQARRVQRVCCAQQLRWQ